MKRNQLLIILLIASVLVATVILLNRRDKFRAQSHTDSIGRDIFSALHLNDTTEIHFTRPGGEKLILTRQKEKWLVTSCYDYPADFSQIADFAQTVGELKTKQRVEAGKSQYTRLKLADPDQPAGAGNLVELKAKGKVMAAFILGKMHMKKGSTRETAGQQWPNGRYLRVKPDDRLAVIDKTLDQADREMETWLDKDFISADKLKSASLQVDGKIQWTLGQNEKDKTLRAVKVPEGKEFDIGKANEIGSSLNSLKFVSVANPQTPPAESGLDKAAVFTAETNDGLKYELAIGKEKNAKRFVKITVSNIPITQAPAPEGEKAEDKEKREKEYREKIAESAVKAKEQQQQFGKWIYLINSYSADNMLVKTNELFKDKKKAEKKTETKGWKIEIPKGIRHITTPTTKNSLRASETPSHIKNVLQGSQH